MGLHGDGLIHRTVLWPVVDAGGLRIVTVVAVGRRFWCPSCHAHHRVAHPGLERGMTYAVAAVVALLRAVVGPPIGGGMTEAEAFRLARGRDLSVSERARSGRPRWSSLRRWAAHLDVLFPAVPSWPGAWRARAEALVVGLGPGAELVGLLEAAIHAHRRGGLAM